ncbi:hypothetical protein HNP00_000165 [Arthrobacter sp. AZCC_0090]|nr:hypothetical protein [Arthrobacter sp. AZCC_0090]
MAVSRWKDRLTDVYIALLAPDEGCTDAPMWPVIDMPLVRAEPVCSSVESDADP